MSYRTLAVALALVVAYAMGKGVGATEQARLARLSEALRWLHANGTQFSWQRDLIDRALREAGDGGPRGDG